MLSATSTTIGAQKTTADSGIPAQTPSCQQAAMASNPTTTKYVFAAKFNDFASKISPLIFNDLAAILNDLAANLFQIRR